MRKTQNQKLRWAVIGCGDVVEHKSGPSIQLAKGSEIVAVMRRNRAKAEEYALKHNIPIATDNAEKILKNPDIDIVYIATPPNSHHDYALAAADAGKHVLVEKPMALNAQQGQAMIEACKKAGVELFVAYYRRFYPQVEKMRELIQQGRIGKPVQAFIDIASGAPQDTGWREKPEISSGGFFVDIGSHRLDAMVSLLGDVEEVKGVATSFDENKQVEQTVSISLKFKSGAQCSVTGDFYSGRTADRFSIYGTAGCISTDVLDSSKFTLQTENDTEQFTFEKLPAPHLGLIRHIESVLAGKCENQSSGIDGLITERILDQAVRSYYR